MSEILGTAILVIFGVAGGAQITLSHGLQGNGLTGPVCWGVGAYVAIIATANKSGAQLNPAISISLSVFKMQDWQKTGIYCGAQMAGAFIGSILVFVNYLQAILIYSNHQFLVPPVNGATAQIFATFPTQFDPSWKYNQSPTNYECFFDQFIGTMMLLMALQAVLDNKNALFEKDRFPQTMALTLVAVGSAFGYNCQGAVITISITIELCFFL